MKKEKVALVLSGGAALGAVELGILSVLEKQYEFEFFAGTSVGSMIATFLNLGKSADEIFKIFDTKKIRDILTDFSSNGFGMVRGENFLKFLETAFENRNFDSFDCPMEFVTADFTNGKRIDLHSGSVAEAVRASCGIPIFFQPYFHSAQKKWLVDGGLCQNFPIDIVLKKYSGKKIIGITVGTFVDESVDFSQTSLMATAKNFKPLIERTIRIMMRNQHQNFSDERLQIFAPDLKDFSQLSIRKKDLKAMFEYGKNFAEKKLLELS